MSDTPQGQHITAASLFASVVRVERADPHQTVHAALARQVAHGVRTLDFSVMLRTPAYRRRPGQLLHANRSARNTAGTSAAASPPSRTLRAPRRRDTEEAIASVVLARLQSHQFDPTDLLMKCQLLVELGKTVRIVGLSGQLEKARESSIRPSLSATVPPGP
jgi:hypothetical protein